jgi:hypothetical protein
MFGCICIKGLFFDACSVFPIFLLGLFVVFTLHARHIFDGEDCANFMWFAGQTKKLILTLASGENMFFNEICFA